MYRIISCITQGLVPFDVQNLDEIRLQKSSCKQLIAVNVVAAALFMLKLK